MVRIVGAGLSCAAALLLTAALPAAETSGADAKSGGRVAQPDRSRGFSGFPDWDSRSGGYDRSRRAEADEKPRDGDRGSGRSDDRRSSQPDSRSGAGGPGGFGPRGFGPGFGRGWGGPGGPRMGWGGRPGSSGG